MDWDYRPYAGTGTQVAVYLHEHGDWFEWHSPHPGLHAAARQIAQGLAPRQRIDREEGAPGDSKGNADGEPRLYHKGRW